MTEATYDPQGKHWSILVKARNGVVSTIRDLTLDEARKMYVALDPMRAWWESIAYATNSTNTEFHVPSSFGIEDHDMVLREVFGPPGWSAAEVKTWVPVNNRHTIKWGEPGHPWFHKWTTEDNNDG